MKTLLKQNIAINVRALLGLKEGESGVSKLIKLGIANGNAQRIKDGETSIGADLIEQLAKALRVEPWQLCVPHLDPQNLPRLQPGGGLLPSWPFRQIEPGAVLGLVGSAAQNVENGLLVVLSTLNLPARGLAPVPPAPPPQDPEVEHVARLFARIEHPANRRIARAIMEQFVDRPPPDNDAGPPGPGPSPAPATDPGAPPAKRRAGRTQKHVP